MAFLPTEVLEHFATHHGVATRTQLIDLGLTEGRIIGLRHAGTLVQVLKGVYRIPVVPFDEAARCVAVCAAHDDAVICGPTAGRLWELRRIPADHRIHAIVKPRRQPSIESWVRPYRTAAIRDDDIVERGDGIRVTSRARTALDLARHVNDTDLLSIIEQVARDGHLSDEELRRVAVDFVSKRRPWLARYLLQLDRRLAGGAAESHPETILGDALGLPVSPRCIDNSSSICLATARRDSTSRCLHCGGRLRSTSFPLMPKPRVDDETCGETSRRKLLAGIPPVWSKASWDQRCPQPCAVCVTNSTHAAPSHASNGEVGSPWGRRRLTEPSSLGLG